MAAGLSLTEDKIDVFRKQINENCILTEEDLIPKVTIDVAMPLSYISKDLITQLSFLEPFGKSNTKPVFAQKEVNVLNHRMIGKNKNVLSMKLDDGAGRVLDGICFQDADKLEKLLLAGKKPSVAYYPGINSYQGRESIQIVISHFQ